MMHNSTYLSTLQWYYDVVYFEYTHTYIYIYIYIKLKVEEFIIARWKKWTLEARRAYAPNVLWKSPGERRGKFAAPTWGFQKLGSIFVDPRTL